MSKKIIIWIVSLTVLIWWAIVFTIQQSWKNIQSQDRVCYDQAIHNFTILEECSKMSIQDRERCMNDKWLSEDKLDVFAASCQNFIEKSWISTCSNSGTNEEWFDCIFQTLWQNR